MAQSEYSPKTNTIERRALPSGVIMRVFDSVGYFCFRKGSVSAYVEIWSAGQVALPHVLCVCRSGGQGRPVFPLHPAAPCRWLSPCAVLCVRRAGDTTGACAAPAANGSIKQKKAPAGAVPAGVFPFYPPNSSSFVSMSAGAQPQAHKRAGKNSGFHFFTGAVPRILCVRRHILLTASSTALGLTFFTKSGNVGTEIL